MWAIIGGSGFESFEGFKPIKDLPRETPFGEASKGIKLVSFEGKELVFIPRHGEGHHILPGEVNYRANIYALKKMKVTKLLTFSAVGSLQAEYPPGDMVVPTQFIDRTKGIRKPSFCGEGIVGHVSLAEPVTQVFQDELKSVSAKLSFQTHFDKTLVVMEGPQFSTKAESHLYRSWGADIVGMTSHPEFALAREAGLSFLNCCFVTDYDCWKDDVPHVTVEQVIKIMKQNNSKAFEVARLLVHSRENSVQTATEIENGLKCGLMTDANQLPEEKQNIIKVLTS